MYVHVSRSIREDIREDVMHFIVLYWSWVNTLNYKPLARMRSEGCSSCPVCLSVYDYSSTKAKSPHYFSCPCSTEAVGIAHKPPRSL